MNALRSFFIFSFFKNEPDIAAYKHRGVEACDDADDNGEREFSYRGNAEDIEDNDCEKSCKRSEDRSSHSLADACFNDNIERFIDKKIIIFSDAVKNNDSGIDGVAEDR